LTSACCVEGAMASQVVKASSCGLQKFERRSCLARYLRVVSSLPQRLLEVAIAAIGVPGFGGEKKLRS
jgi:hypothetical protein